MKTNSCILLFFFFTFLASLIQVGHCFAVKVNVSAGQGLVQKTCQHVPHIELCEKSLVMDPNSGQADMEGLALISLKVALENATETSHHMSKMLNDSTLDPFIEQCLMDCVEQYWDAMDQIEDSLAAVTSKDYHDVNDWVKAAIADADTCELGFTEKPGYESMVTQNNVVLKQLCLNALSIISQLQSPA